MQMSSNVQSNFVLTLTNVCIQQPDTKVIYPKYYKNSNTVKFSVVTNSKTFFVYVSIKNPLHYQPLIARVLF